MKWGTRSFATGAIACLVAGLVAAVAVGAGQTFTTSLVRGKGTALILKVSSKKTIDSYGFELKKKEKGYTITSAKLTKVNGKPVTSSYYKEACSPAQWSKGYPLERPPGNGVVCGFSTGLPPNAKSLVIDFTTSKCLPADAITGIAGPAGACR